MKSRKDDALSIVARYLRKLANGSEVKPEHCKLMSDMCFLALPMKYRMDKTEIEAEGFRRTTREEPQSLTVVAGGEN